MRDLDDTDRQILRLLLADARRPFSGIADHVGLSPPAVSDRIDRLRELGVIRSFTVDIDRSVLRDGVPVLVDIDVPPGGTERVREGLRELDAVEHTFEAADGRVVVQASVVDGDVSGLLAEAIDVDLVRDLDVRLLKGSDWTPSLGNASLALTCAECENTVTAEGESSRFGGDLYHFCCNSCLSQFADRFERFESGA